MCGQTIGCGYWKDITSTGFPKPYLCEHRWPEVSAMVRWRRAVYTAGKGFSGYQARFDAGNKVMAASYAGKGFFMLNIGAEAFRCAWLVSTVACLATLMHSALILAKSGGTCKGSSAPVC